MKWVLYIAVEVDLLTDRNIYSTDKFKHNESDTTYAWA